MSTDPNTPADSDTPADSPLTNRSGNRRGMVQATTGKYPRAYLLSVYNAAIEHGMVLLQPFPAEDVKSFTASFINLRRPKSVGAVTFITPEMHLVSVGRWRPEAGGTLPIYYTSTEEALPAINPAGPEEHQYFPPSPNPAHFPIPTATEAAFPHEGTDDEDFDVEGFLDELVHKAAERPDE